jgi:uncharacterized CHY-type Zn-finger protein
MSTQKRARCKNGTRKNKKTKKCESVLDHTCSICLDRITSGNIKTKCKHNFHKGCLIGWCKNQTQLRVEKTHNCPICRKDINTVCKKIMPFASEEVFRYTSLAGADKNRLTYSLEKIDEIIHNPRFDVNVKNQWGESLLYELSWNKYNNDDFKKYVDYLLQKSGIVVSVDLISALIANGNTEMIAVYKKHKKIPKALKSLV